MEKSDEKLFKLLLSEGDWKDCHYGLMLILGRMFKLDPGIEINPVVFSFMRKYWRHLKADQLKTTSDESK